MNVWPLTSLKRERGPSKNPSFLMVKRPLTIQLHTKQASKLIPRWDSMLTADVTLFYYYVNCDLLLIRWTTSNWGTLKCFIPVYVFSIEAGSPFFRNMQYQQFQAIIVFQRKSYCYKRYTEKQTDGQTARRNRFRDSWRLRTIYKISSRYFVLCHRDI